MSKSCHAVPVAFGLSSPVAQLVNIEALGTNLHWKSVAWNIIASGYAAATNEHLCG